MVRWPIAFLVLTVLSALFGFTDTDIGYKAAEIAQKLFGVFAALFAFSLLARLFMTKNLK